jgi:type IV pilus assembly protein PilM
MAKIIGLDIGSHSIKLVGLKITSRGRFLTHFGVKEIPRGSDKEDGDFIAETIKAIFREAGLKPGKVRLTVSGAGVHIRQVTLPSMPKADLPEAVRWEIRAYLPFPADTARIDFYILDEFVENNAQKLALIVVACPPPLIDRTLSLAGKAGLRPVHLDVAPFALWNILLAWDGFQRDEGVALLDIGDDKTGLHIFQGGILQFSREITPAGADITRAIMEGIGSADETNLLYERAERIKKEVGIPAEGTPEGTADESISVSKISFWVRPVLERMAAEIRRSLDYYRNQFNTERMDRLLLTGGGSNLKNIAPYLTQELGLPVERLNPLPHIFSVSRKIDGQILDQMGPIITVAAGAALAGPKEIELLQAPTPIWSGPRLEKLIPRLSLSITLLIFLLIAWYMNGQLTSLQKEREVKVAKLKALESLQTQLTSLQNREVQMKQDLSLLPPAMVTPVPMGDLFRAVSRTVPENVTLTLLSIQSKEESAKQGSSIRERRELQIKGLAFGSDLHCLTALGQIIERLEKSSSFQNVKLASAHENQSYTRAATEFEILCGINLAEARRKEGR